MLFINLNVLEERIREGSRNFKVIRNLDIDNIV